MRFSRFRENLAEFFKDILLTFLLPFPANVISFESRKRQRTIMRKIERESIRERKRKRLREVNIKIKLSK